MMQVQWTPATTMPLLMNALNNHNNRSETNNNNSGNSRVRSTASVRPLKAAPPILNRVLSSGSDSGTSEIPCDACDYADIDNAVVKKVQDALDLGATGQSLLGVALEMLHQTVRFILCLVFLSFCILSLYDVMYVHIVLKSQPYYLLPYK